MRCILFCSLFSLLAVGALAQTAGEPVIKSYGTDDSLVQLVGADKSPFQIVIEFSIDKKGSPFDVSIIDSPPNHKDGMPQRYLEDCAESFVMGWRFDVSKAISAHKRRYRTTILFKFVNEYYDPRNGPPGIIRGDSFHSLEITLPDSDIDLSKCPAGEEESVPSKIAKDDFVEVSKLGCEIYSPLYSVRIHANGNVAWDGRESVVTMGRHDFRIDAKVAHDLVERFRSKEFWSLCREYYSNSTGGCTDYLKVQIGGRSRMILDYEGPEVVKQFERVIDQAADSHRWSHGDPSTEPISHIYSEDDPPKPGQTPLMLAMLHGADVKEMKALIDAGANVSAVDASGWSALMYMSAFSGSYNGSDSEPLKLLLRAGADPNQGSLHGDTPLMFAALEGDWSDDLVKAGAKINVQNKDGQTALMILAARWDKVDAIRAALQAGADASLKDAKGRTALDYLRLANCGKSPMDDSIVRGPSRISDCTGFQADDLLKAETLLDDASRRAPVSAGAKP